MLVAAKKIELDESYLAEGRAEAEAEAAAMMRVRHHPHLLKVIDSIYIEDKEDKLYEFWLFTELCNLGMS
jgi:serine/threonine protein kinase